MSLPSIGSITITQSGLKYLQSYTHAEGRGLALEMTKLPSICKSNSSNPHPNIKPNPKNQLSPRQQPQSHEEQLRKLPFRLNKIFSQQTLKPQDLKLKSESVLSLRRELLRDMVYVNQYTKRKAGEIADRLFENSWNGKGSAEGNQSKGGAEERGNVFMELSKSRNYLARINFLHSQQAAKSDSLKRFLLKNRNKQNHE